MLTESKKLLKWVKKGNGVFQHNKFYLVRGHYGIYIGNTFIKKDFFISGLKRYIESYDLKRSLNIHENLTSLLRRFEDGSV